jgi:GTP cyclohydrolase I
LTDEEKFNNIENSWKTILDTIFGKGSWEEDSNLSNTPKRMSKSIIEKCRGINSYDECIDILSKETFSSTYDGIITIGPLHTSSLCPHHFESIMYTIWFGYLPNKYTGNVVGLSKPGRVIELFAKQPILQEEYTRKIANIFMTVLNPEGIGVIVKGKHMCMVSRGIEQTDSYTITSEMRGVFRESVTVKNEFMKFCNL